MLAGCSGTADDTTTTTQASAATTVTATPNLVEVTALDFAFAGLPDAVKAGTEFTLVNASDTELHEFVAVRLADDDTRTVEAILALPPEELGALFADVSTVLLAPPGSNEVIPAVGNGTLVEPGRYAIVCAIPTGADPQEYLTAAATSEGPPQVDGGLPHFVQGMFGEVTVTE
jgi:hypothetical protein